MSRGVSVLPTIGAGGMGAGRMSFQSSPTVRVRGSWPEPGYKLVPAGESRSRTPRASARLLSCVATSVSFVAGGTNEAAGRRSVFLNAVAAANAAALAASPAGLGYDASELTNVSQVTGRDETINSAWPSRPLKYTA